jgi:predicted AAA+ superfamily ATPase
MGTEALGSVQRLLEQAASLLLYQAVLSDLPGRTFVALLKAIRHCKQNVTSGTIECLQAYGAWFEAMAACDRNWHDHLLTRILQADNTFTQRAQRVALPDLPAALVSAARHDLQILQSLSSCTGEQLSQWVAAVTNAPIGPVPWQVADAPDLETFHLKLQTSNELTAALADLAAYYRQHGTGLLATYGALRWQARQLVGIAYPDRVELTHLVGYEWQKEALLKNTEFLLRGYPALHVLLYGSRGSGKSSLVKALLHQYRDRGLRLIEVAKADLEALPSIVDRLRDLPQKFIIFVDDLSFEEEEDAYKALKVVLEGNVTARPQNVVVYATSNRRHLIREFFGDRPRPKDSEEVHAWDTMQEKLSFSDRFGLTLTFEPADQSTYLKIIHHLAAQAGIALSAADLEARALQWATRHNGRSGRTARQFIDFLHAELAVLEAERAIDRC